MVDPRQVLSDAVLVLVQAIQCGHASVHHKVNCMRLTDRLKTLLPLLEDLKHVSISNELAAAATFERLESAALKAKDLIHQCGIPALALYMVSHAAAVVEQFNDVTSELLRCLSALPLLLLSASDGMRAQVAKVTGEMRSVRYTLDGGTKRLAGELELALMEHRKGVTGNKDLLLRIANQLSLTSMPLIHSARTHLAKTRDIAIAKEDKSEELYLTQVMSLLSSIQAQLVADRDAAKEAGSRSKTDAAENSSQPRPPREYCCPLSLELMADPVILASGQTFERVFIERWLEQGNNSCPLTKHVLSHSSLIPNFAMRSSIAAWCKAHNVSPPQVKKLPPNATIRGPGVIDFHTWLLDKPEDKPPMKPNLPAGLPRGGSPPVIAGMAKSSLTQGVSRRTRSVRFEVTPQLRVPPEVQTGAVAEAEAAVVSVAAAEEAASAGEEGSNAAAGIKVEEKVAEEVCPAGKAPLPPAGPGEVQEEGQQGSLSPASDYSETGSGTPPVEVLPVRSTAHNAAPVEDMAATEGSPAALEKTSLDSMAALLQEMKEEHRSHQRQLSSESLPTDVVDSSLAASPLRGSFQESPGRMSVASADSGPSSSSQEFSLQEGSVCESFREDGSTVDSAPSPLTAAVSLSAEELEEVARITIQLLEGDIAQVVEAAQAVRQLARSSEDHRKAFGSQGAVAPLMECLSKLNPAQNQEAMEACVLALLNLSVRDANKAMLMQQDCVPVIVRLLSGPSSGVKEGAAALLFSLSAASENRQVIATTEAAKGLVDVLVSGSKRAKQDVLCAAYNLSMAAAPAKLALVQGGILKPTLYIAKKGVQVFGSTMVEKSVSILYNLSWVREGQAGIVRGGGIPIMCQLVEKGSAKSKEDAVACLLRLVVESSAFKALVYKEDIIAPLMLLGHYGSQRAKLKAKALLKQLSSSRV